MPAVSWAIWVPCRWRCRGLPRPEQCIVDAIPHHRHPFLAAQLLEALQLLLRQHLPAKSIGRQAKLMAETAHGRFPIATEHREMEALIRNRCSAGSTSARSWSSI